MGSHADLVMTEVKRQLSLGELRPGDPLDESALKSQFGLSITPIREALLMLEAMGLVERRKRAGARITTLSLETLIGLVETDAELEGACAFFAAQRINPEQRARLEQALIDCEAFAENSENNAADYYGLNLKFHRVIFEASGNPQLQEMIEQVGMRLVYYFLTQHTIQGEIARSAREHRAVFEAIIAGDQSLARTLMSEHCAFDRNMPLTVLNMTRRVD